MELVHDRPCLGVRSRGIVRGRPKGERGGNVDTGLLGSGRRAPPPRLLSINEAVKNRPRVTPPFPSHPTLTRLPPSFLLYAACTRRLPEPSTALRLPLHTRSFYAYAASKENAAVRR